MTDNYELSRRKTLLGLATIGAAGAGAGLGTSAYFNDEELFEGNQLTAGELDLFVAYEFTADQDGVEGDDFPVSGIVQGDEDDEATVSYELDDVKPGDSGTLRFCPRVVDNPAWVWVGSGEVTDFENGQPEPEQEADGTDGDEEGELSENIQLTISLCDQDGETLYEYNNPDDYTLADLADEISDEGFLLDGDTESEGNDPYPGSEDSETQEGPCVCVEWEIPTTVGNEIQTDSVEFDLSFYAEQVRHNDDPENPYAEESAADAS